MEVTINGVDMSRLMRFLVGILVVLSSCSTAPTAANRTVVVSFSVLGDIVENVVGDAATVKTFVGPDSDAHAYEPTPQDAVALEQATAVVTIGLGFEPWLDEIYAASGSKSPVIVSSAALKPIKVDPSAAGHADEEGHAEEEEAHAGEAEELDPHVWHDAQNVITMVETIRDGLIAAMPDQAQTFRANSTRYIAELQQLDADIVTMVDSIPVERRKLVTNHDTFGYFAQRYGFVVVGTVLGVSTEGNDPSATEIVALTAAIRESAVPTIFIENMSNSSLIDNVAAEAGVTIAPALYTDALGSADSDGATYLNMMRYNVTTMKTALQGK
ncbi:MAG: metal ABC transporter substrate-binding protein [Chloroflexi bacterium]|nr:MAG: metal ABC transporter substrate-binding protein [Chloroflexota bacterium]